MMNETSEKLNNQAVTLAAQGHYDEAIACLKRAITVEKTNYLLWFNLGLTYRDNGDFEDAQLALERALQIDDENEEIIETLALVCFEQKKYQEAVYYVAMGMDINSDNAHLWNMLGVIYFNLHDYEFASEAFEQALMLNPYYEEALFNLRDTYGELHNKVGKEECENRLKQIQRAKK